MQINIAWLCNETYDLLIPFAICKRLAYQIGTKVWKLLLGSCLDVEGFSSRSIFSQGCGVAGELGEGASEFVRSQGCLTHENRGIYMVVPEYRARVHITLRYLSQHTFLRDCNVKAGIWFGIMHSPLYYSTKL